MSGGRGRRYGGAAPVPLLVVLVVVVAFLLLTSRRTEAGAPAGSAPGSAAGSAAGSAEGSGGGQGPAAAGGAGALAVGRGPQQRYTVHEDAPAGACHYHYEQGKPLPDPICTPGAVSPAVTEATIARTICASGYTKTVRPPRDVTDREKRLSSQAYAYRGSFATSEYDHLVPLGLGGDPNDARNLWLEPNDDPAATTNTNGKDAVEATLRAAVCGRRVALADAQRAIAADWVTALSELALR